ncbi:MAG: hypothetical protein ACQESC_02700 [Nanobdellota archaeon]
MIKNNHNNIRDLIINRQYYQALEQLSGLKKTTVVNELFKQAKIGLLEQKTDEIVSTSIEKILNINYHNEYSALFKTTKKEITEAYHNPTNQKYKQQLLTLSKKLDDYNHTYLIKKEVKETYNALENGSLEKTSNHIKSLYMMQAGFKKDIPELQRITEQAGFLKTRKDLSLTAKLNSLEQEAEHKEFTEYEKQNINPLYDPTLFPDKKLQQKLSTKKIYDSLN